MKASAVSNAISVVSSNSGIGRIYANIMRKSAATEVFLQAPNVAECVSIGMDHSLATHKARYRMVEK